MRSERLEKGYSVFELEEDIKSDRDVIDMLFQVPLSEAEYIDEDFDRDYD